MLTDQEKRALETARRQFTTALGAATLEMTRSGEDLETKAETVLLSRKQKIDDLWSQAESTFYQIAELDRNKASGEIHAELIAAKRACIWDSELLKQDQIDRFYPSRPAEPVVIPESKHSVAGLSVVAPTPPVITNLFSVRSAAPAPAPDVSLSSSSSASSSPELSFPEPGEARPKFTSSSVASVAPVRSVPDGDLKKEPWQKEEESEKSPSIMRRAWDAITNRWQTREASPGWKKEDLELPSSYSESPLDPELKSPERTVPPPTTASLPKSSSLLKRMMNKMIEIILPSKEVMKEHMQMYREHFTTHKNSEFQDLGKTLKISAGGCEYFIKPSQDSNKPNIAFMMETPDDPKKEKDTVLEMCRDAANAAIAAYEKDSTRAEAHFDVSAAPVEFHAEMIKIFEGKLAAYQNKDLSKKPFNVVAVTLKEPRDRPSGPS